MRMHKISQCNDFKAALLYRFLPQATKSGTDSGSEGGTFRDHVMDAVELFESRKVWLRLSSVVMEPVTITVSVWQL